MDIWNEVFGDIKKFEKKLNFNFLNNYFRDLLVFHPGENKREQKEESEKEKEKEEEVKNVAASNNNNNKSK